MRREREVEEKHVASYLCQYSNNKIKKNMVQKCVHVHVNAKMITVDTVQGMGVDKREWCRG
jgi:hypothetical protein